MIPRHCLTSSLLFLSFLSSFFCLFSFFSFFSLFRFLILQKNFQWLEWPLEKNFNFQHFRRFQTFQINNCLMSRAVREVPLCLFFRSSRGCKNGDSCSFRHAAEYPTTHHEPSPQSYAAAVGSPVDNSSKGEAETGTAQARGGRKLCTFFAAGYCKFGDSCKNQHDESIVKSVPSASLGLECGICMGKLEGNQIGMLNNCNCLFCLNCIRGWRREGLDIADSEQVRWDKVATAKLLILFLLSDELILIRLCPLCRNESHFVVPMYRHVTDAAEKARLLEEYRTNLGRIQCKASFIYRSVSIYWCLVLRSISSQKACVPLGRRASTVTSTPVATKPEETSD